MKTITETIGGAQSLLGITYNLQSCFEEYLTNEYKTFLHIVRAAETFLPVCMRVRKRTGKPRKDTITEPKELSKLEKQIHDLPCRTEQTMCADKVRGL